MCGHILGVDAERFLELIRSPAEILAPAFLAPGAALDFRAIEQRLAELVDHLVVAAEIEPPGGARGRAGREHAREVVYGLIEKTVLLVDQPAQPRDCPRRGARRAMQRGRRLVQPAFLVEHPGEVQRAVRPPEPLHLAERISGHPELALLAPDGPFEQQPDSVIVPPFPGGCRRSDLWRRCVLRAGDWK